MSDRSASLTQGLRPRPSATVFRALSSTKQTRFFVANNYCGHSVLPHHGSGRSDRRLDVRSILRFCTSRRDCIVLNK